MIRTTKTTTTRKHLHLEALESRTLLAASLTGSTLNVLGTANHDVAVVANRMIQGVSKIEVTLNGTVKRFDTSAVKQIVFKGFAGNDSFTAQANVNVSVIAHGGIGNDTLTGGSAADSLNGEAGNDVLDGRAGDDWIHAGAGNDTLLGGVGNDWLYGNLGDDVLQGQAGNDNLFGHAGLDKLYGGAGDDTLVSLDRGATDLLYGETGRDSFWFDQNGAKKDSVLDATAFEKSNTHAISKFENGTDRTLDGDKIADPTDGKNYKNFGTRYLFSNTGPSRDDVDQNGLGDCWLQAALGATAQASPNSIRQTVVDLGDGTFAVRLGGKYYRVDADLPTTSATSETLTYAGFGQGGTLWGPIVEKAYALYRVKAGTTPNTYASLNGGFISEALTALGATDVGLKEFDSYANATDLLNGMAAKLAAGYAVGAGGIQTAARGAPLVTKHAYTVVRVNYVDGVAVSVTLRNPWAKDGAGNQDGADDGYVTVTGEQLLDGVGGRVYWGKPVA